MTAASFVDTNVLVYADDISGCAILYSEDLQSGRRFEKLQVVNPFA